MNFSACCIVSSSVAPSSGGVKPARVEYFSHVREESFRACQRRKRPKKEEKRERRGFSLYSLLFLKNPKKTTTRRINDERGRYFYFSRGALRARASAFSFTRAARDWILFFPSYPKRERCIFFPNRARERAGEREREREKRLKERERTHTTHRKETTASMGPLRSPLKSPCLCVFVLFKCLLGPFCVALRVGGRETM